jgi:hypothetical protein
LAASEGPEENIHDRVPGKRLDEFLDFRQCARGFQRVDKRRRCREWDLGVNRN